jgi:coenzyme PQQ precursor peptide PqqA
MKADAQPGLMKIMSGIYGFSCRGRAGACHRIAAKVADRRPNFPVEGSVEEELAMWTKPEYTEMRFGFEVTMYIANR